MKTAIGVLLVLCSMTVQADEWTTEDTYWQVGSTVLRLIDRGQTKQIKNYPWMYETNRELGLHPTDRQIDRYFAKAIILDAVVSYLLPSKWRRAWQVSTVYISVDAISDNRKLGLSIKF